ncbi:energy-coupling factor ABC transporter ATP-binding protein [Kineococcus rhizosphaerae]|uniref:Biotin transport system ATP-binding protein n=1 Tax=Kineococcus rhizosphaerae TaxID=559628 RepID=A0A2T0R3M7_9ACTN|nr:ABC transporter ATP-binding protein [Kineococcus rhizosphaerae]PRY14678.1 biotin transport system ATP-binding protein [Kineococcus rhizosphaerae]
MIRLDGVRVDAEDRVVLHPLDLELTDPFTVLVGPNGSGKSTLLRLLDGLVLPSAGRVLVDGIDPEQRLKDLRRHVGFVFTDPDAQLVMPTAVEDVALSLRRTGVRDRQAAARALLAAAGLGELAERSVRDISSGQRQLLALTTVLATEPAVLLADEPTTLLDLRTARRVADVLRDPPAHVRQVVVATHDLDLAARADRALWIEDGRVHADGTAAEVLTAYRGSA